MSLVVLTIRYMIEFVYVTQTLEIYKAHDVEDPTKTKISVSACLVLILISDLLPIVTSMLCIWISSKGKWDSLMSGFLHNRQLNSNDDKSTYAGSVILDRLRDELIADEKDNIWPSEADDSVYHHRFACF